MNPDLALPSDYLAQDVGPQLIATASVMICLHLFAVGTRLFARRAGNKPFFLDDYLIILAAVCFRSFTPSLVTDQFEGRWGGRVRHCVHRYVHSRRILEPTLRVLLGVSKANIGRHVEYALSQNPNAIRILFHVYIPVKAWLEMMVTLRLACVRFSTYSDSLRNYVCQTFDFVLLPSSISASQGTTGS